jgi:hypothetical protein
MGCDGGRRDGVTAADGGGGGARRDTGVGGSVVTTCVFGRTPSSLHCIRSGAIQAPSALAQTQSENATSPLLSTSFSAAATNGHLAAVGALSSCLLAS